VSFGRYKPGDYGQFLAHWRTLPLAELRRIHAELVASAAFGCAHPRANYRRSLEQAIHEHERQWQ
jgi:hypothetical protein